MAINNGYESTLSTEQSTSKWGMTVSKMPPTDKPQAHREAVSQDAEKSTSQVLPTSQMPTGMQSTETRTKKSTEKSTKMSTQILLKQPIKRNYEIDQMDTKADFQRRLPSQPASGSQCHLPKTTAWEIVYEALYEGSRERRHTWTW